MGKQPPNPAETDPKVAFDVPAPPEGRYAAVTDMSAPGARILFRDVKLDGRARLPFTVFYDNAGEFASPASLDFDGCEANQQLRVELLDLGAPADTTAAKARPCHDLQDGARRPEQTRAEDRDV